MKKIIESNKKRYIRNGIRSDINVRITERPQHTFLGSTDRKAYTLEFEATYLDRSYSAFTTIEPYFSKEETDRIIEKTTEEARNKIADQIYKEMYEN